MYFIEYHVGSFLLGIKTQPVEMTLEWFKNNLDNIFIPLYFGTLIFSVVGSTAAYFAVNYFWELSVNKDKKKHRYHR